MADRPARRVRWLLPATLIGLGILVVAATALWLLLPTIASRIAADRLAAMGVPAPRLIVADIGYRRSTAIGFSAGTGQELTVREIVVDYSPADLLDGRVERVTLRAPTLRASLGPDGLSLGSLDALLAGSGDGTFPQLPPITVEDASVDLATAFGSMIASGSGEIASSDTHMRADFELAVVAPQGTARGELGLDISGKTVEARLNLVEGRIDLPELAGASATGRLAATLMGGQLAGLNGEIAVRELTIGDSRAAPLGPLAGSLTIAHKLDSWRMAAVLADAGNTVHLSSRITAPSWDADEPIAFALEVGADAAAPVWPILGLPTPTAGKTSARLVTEATPSQLIAAVEGGTPPGLAGSLTLDLDGLAFDGVVQRISATAGIDLYTAGDALRLTAAAPVLAEVSLDQALLNTAGLPPPTVAFLAQPLAATVELTRPLLLRRDGVAFMAEGAVALAIDLPDDHRLLHASGTAEIALGDEAGSAATLSSLNARLDVPAASGMPPATVTADGSASIDRDGGTAALKIAAEAPDIEVEGLRARKMRLDLPLAIVYGRQDLAVRLTDSGSLSAARLDGLSPLQLEGPVQLSFIPGDVPSLTMRFADPDGPRATADLLTGPLRLAGAMEAEHGRVMSELALPGLQLSAGLDAAGWSGKLTANGGTLKVPSHEIEATDLDFMAELPEAGAPRLSLTAALSHRHEPALVVPLSASLKAHQVEGGWAFTGHAADAFKRISIDIDGRHSLARNSGAATLRVAPIEFAPNVRQPNDLAPFLAGIAEDVSGTIALAGELSWDADGIGSDLELLLRDVSATTAAATIDRLNGVITVDGLMPFSTPPGQRVAVAAIDAGLPLTDGLLTFRVARGPKLEIADGQLHLAGGTVNLEPMVFDPAGDSNAAVLAVSGVDLGKLLALAQVDGLTGEGKLTGRIPVRLVQRDVVIKGGELEAEAPGRLSYAPLTPPAALQGQGETVSLALSALTDFQYQQLRLTVDRQAGGEMLVGMHVRGSNPDFYDGYPVEFNLTVSGALDRVLRQSLAGYRIPDTIEERLKEFAQ